jgi:quinol monooxygenase YgiN
VVERFEWEILDLEGRVCAMYGVIRRYKLDSANFDESVRRVEQGLASKISASPGFVSYRVLRAENGDALSVSVFDASEQAEDAAKTVADWVKENLAELMPNPPEVTAGEVLLREVNGQEELHYGVMRRYKTDADIHEILRRAQSGFVPIVSKMPGFASYVIMDAGGGTLVSLSGFRDQASADRSTQEAASWVRDNLAELLPNPPEITRAEAKISRVR